MRLFIGGLACFALLFSSLFPTSALCADNSKGVEKTLQRLVVRKAAGGQSYGKALLLANWATLGPVGRILLNTFSENSSEDYRYEAAVLLEYGEENDTFEWRATVPEVDYEQADSNRKYLVKKYTRRAMKALARRVGYFDRLYGNEESSVPDTRLLRVTITDLEENYTQVLFPN